MPNPYDILQVTRSANDADIKKAYRKLAKQWHPDRNRDDPKAKDRFAELNNAYEILSDTDKRGQFDRGEIDGDGKPKFQGFEGFGRGQKPSGFEGFQFGFGPQGARSGVNPGDFFSDIFGEGLQPKQSRNRAIKGEDVSLILSISLEDMAGSVTKRVMMPTGREVEVSIPKGVTDGQVIRLRGLGQPSPMTGGEAGDAMLTLKIAPHPLFAVEDNNLRLKMPITWEDAVLGSSLHVPTLNGAVTMNIPPLTSSGRVFRLRGKGLPGKKEQGDLLVSIDIRLPDALDDELKAFAEKRRERK